MSAKVYEKVAEEFGMSKKKAKEVVDYVLNTIVDDTVADGSVKCGLKHYFKRVDRGVRSYHDMENGGSKEYGPFTYVVYKKRIDGAAQADA